MVVFAPSAQSVLFSSLSHDDSQNILAQSAKCLNMTFLINDLFVIQLIFSDFGSPVACFVKKMRIQPVTSAMNPAQNRLGSKWSMYEAAGHVTLQLQRELVFQRLECNEKELHFLLFPVGFLQLLSKFALAVCFLLCLHRTQQPSHRS